MAKRYSWPFLAGGFLTLLLFFGVWFYGKKMAGMSAGIGASSDSPVISWDTTMIFLACSYFFISAFGLLVSKTKRALWIWAVSTHIAALAAYAIFFFACQNSGNGGYAWLGLVTIFIAVYFSPWVLLWLHVLTLKSDNFNAS